ncbi:MAG: sulfatase-like hydrolase/transferase [Rikenellaceae bacterium]
MKISTNNRLILASLALVPTLANAADNRPNIIFLMTDDQSIKSIHAQGYDNLKTPNLDNLVSQGVSFMSHYATTSISMASRAITMTGMYEYKTGTNFLHGGMDPAMFELSYPVLLQKNGYFTGFAGKFGFALNAVEGKDNCNSYSVLPVDRFDMWAGGTGQTHYETEKNKYLTQYAKDYPHSSRAYGAFGCDFIDEAKKSGKPFCLSISFKAPHSPTTVDPKFLGIYDDTTFEVPKSAADADTRLPLQARLGRQFLTFFGKEKHKNFEESVRGYHSQIYGVDYAVGMIVEKLKAEGLDKNTIVIFTSDNGWALGEHRLGGKVLPYESSSRIPLVIVDPREGKTKGEFTKAISGNIDIAPTILDYAGVEIPKNMDGTSLSPVVKNPKAGAHEALSLINVWGSPGCFSLAIVSEGMKYIYWCFGDKMSPVEELFDLAKDPGELNNVAKEKKYAKTLDKLRKLHDERLQTWAAEGTKRNNYLQFSTILSRNVDWETRKALIPQNLWNAYEGVLRKQMGYNGDFYNYEEVAKNRH